VGIVEKSQQSLTMQPCQMANTSACGSVDNQNATPQTTQTKLATQNANQKKLSGFANAAHYDNKTKSSDNKSQQKAATATALNAANHNTNFEERYHAGRKGSRKKQRLLRLAQ
jgi:hypothetical protein